MTKRNVLIVAVIAIVITLVTVLVGCDLLYFGDKTPAGIKPAEGTTSDAVLVYEEMARKYTSGAVAVVGGRMASGTLFVGVTYASGFFLTKSGVIIVSDKIDKSTVTTYRVDVLGRDGEIVRHSAVKDKKISGFVVLRIVDAGGNNVFNALTIDDGSGVKYGAPALVVGNPLNIGLLATRAMVAKPSEYVSIGYRSYDGFIIDAPVNTYSHGSPVISANGTILGIVVGRNESGSIDSNGNITPVYDIAYVLHCTELSKLVADWG